MAGGSDNVVIYYRNHNASDTTRESVLNDLVARSVDRLGFSAPEGMEFSAWNTAQDASGISYAVGDTVTLSQNSGAELYAVWVVPVIPYIVTSEELTDVADAIRTKGGTSAALVWPSGYVDAVGAIEGGGGGGDAYVIGMTLSGTTVSNVTYPTGESATTIATAIMDDPSTRVVFSIDVGANHGVMNCTPCSLQASAYPAYGDEATSIDAVMPMWYEDRGGDRKTYLLRLMLYGGNWSAHTRTTI